MKNLALMISLLMVLPGTVVAQVTECWDFGQYSSLAFAPPGPATVMVLPDGSGDPLTRAWDAAGLDVVRLSRGIGSTCP